MMRGAAGALVATLAALLCCTADAQQGIYGRTLLTYNSDVLGNDRYGWRRSAGPTLVRPVDNELLFGLTRRQGHDTDYQSDYELYPAPPRRFNWLRAPARRSDDDDDPPPGNFDEIDFSPLDMGG